MSHTEYLRLIHRTERRQFHFRKKMDAFPQLKLKILRGYGAAQQDFLFQLPVYKTKTDG